jgi:hypothetical protein
MDPTPEHVPGQLHLADVPDGEELERRLAELREQRDAVESALMEHTYRALSTVATAAARASDAGEQLDAAVAAARGAGATWEQIGRAVGITRQTAHARWADRG